MPSVKRANVRRKVLSLPSARVRDILTVYAAHNGSLRQRRRREVKSKGHEANTRRQSCPLARKTSCTAPSTNLVGGDAPQESNHVGVIVFAR